MITASLLPSSGPFLDQRCVSMAVTKISCPSCMASLKSAAAIAVGTQIKCPKCGGTFGYQPDEEEVEVRAFCERDVI